jgi:tetratricopeptide (TPR) repeat protein
MSDLFKNAKMLVDDPMVHSNQLFNDAFELVENGEFDKALSIFEQYRMYHPEEPKVYYELAFCLYALQQYEIALEVVDRALLIRSDYGVAYQLKGLLQVKKGDFTSAIRNLERSNVQIPNDENIIYGLFQAYFMSDLFESALVCINQLRLINPLDNNYMACEAAVYERLGQNEKAISLMERIIEINPNELEYINVLNHFKEQNINNGNNSYPGMNN